METSFTTISEYFVNSIATVLFLPLWIILMIFINAAIPLLSSKKLTLNLTLGASLASIVMALFCVFYCINNPQSAVENNITWLNADIQISFGSIIDNLSSVMLVFAAIISFLVQLYSYGYMKNDKYFHRFYIYLNLFSFALFGLVLASNAIQTFVFWELTAVVSYLLTSFWYQKRSATTVACKSYVVKYIGDICLFAGIIALIYFSVIFTTAQNMILLSYSNLQFTAETLYSMVSENTYLLISLLIFIGIMMKSAQFPFHIWLAKSTEAPVPVLALFNSVSAVAAGVYLFARFYPVFILSKTIMTTIFITGIISALACTYIATSQNDLKKILSYSTSSQLGLIFAGFGAGAFSGAMFHFFAHGVSKAMLFLVAGVIIMALKNESDIRYMGGFRKLNPIAAFTFFVGVISICGVLFSGYYSTAHLFAGIYEFGNQWIDLALVLVVFMSTFCFARAYFLIFEGEQRFELQVENTNWTMKLPIVILSLFVIFAGYVFRNNFEQFIYFIVPEKYTPAYPVQVVIILFVVLCAIYISYNLYVLKNNVFVLLKEKMLNKSNLLYKLSYNAFYLESVCDWFVENVFLKICRLLDFVEKYIINGIVIVFTLTTRIFSYIFSKLQTGNVQSYITYSVFILGAVMLVTALFYILGSLMGV